MVSYEYVINTPTYLRIDNDLGLHCDYCGGELHCFRMTRVSTDDKNRHNILFICECNNYLLPVNQHQYKIYEYGSQFNIYVDIKDRENLLMMYFEILQKLEQLENRDLETEDFIRRYASKFY